MSSLCGVVFVACFVAAPVIGAITKEGKEVPTYTEPCLRDTPEFDTCLKHALQLIIPKVAKVGIPELDLETIDPLKVPQMVKTLKSRLITGEVTLQDTIVKGVSNLKITDVRSVANDPTKFLLEIDYYVPNMEASGHYKMDGQFRNISISGNDTYVITLVKISGTWKLIGTPVEEEGQRFVRIDNFEVVQKVGTLNINAMKLVTGQPQLNAITIALGNHFWRLLTRLMLPHVHRTFDEHLTQTFNNVFMKIPYDQLFPLRQQ